MEVGDGAKDEAVVTKIDEKVVETGEVPVDCADTGDDVVADTTTTVDTTDTQATGAATELAADTSTTEPAVSDDPAEETKPVETVTSSALDSDGTFVVHIDESDTNLDYDLNVDKPEERDAPTPTKDESMDVDAADIVQSNGDVPTDKQPESDAKDSSTTSGQASKRLVFLQLLV